jgi:hypothetical protein
VARVTRILPEHAAKIRTRCEALLRQADKLSSESWKGACWRTASRCEKCKKPGNAGGHAVEDNCGARHAPAE